MEAQRSLRSGPGRGWSPGRARIPRSCRAARLHLAVAMAALAPCVNAPNLPAQQQDFGDSWITHPEFEIGEGAAGTGPAAFGIVSAVRVLGDGDRILVAEAGSLRATIWTPDGSLIREVGRPGEGPGEFAGGFDIQVHREGFLTIDDRGQRFTSFANDGTFIETIPFPPRSLTSGGRGVRPVALVDDGSVFASPMVSPLDLIGGAGAFNRRRSTGTTT